MTEIPEHLLRRASKATQKNEAGIQKANDLEIKRPVTEAATAPGRLALFKNILSDRFPEIVFGVSMLALGHQAVSWGQEICDDDQNIGECVGTVVSRDFNVWEETTSFFGEGQESDAIGAFRLGELVFAVAGLHYSKQASDNKNLV